MATIHLLLTYYSGLVIIMSFIHLIRLEYWWIRIWDFPHLQVFVLTVIGLVAWLVLGHTWQWPLVMLPIGLIGAVLYQLWLIVPYTQLHKKEVPTWISPVNQRETRLDTIRLLSANVYQENTKMPDVLRLIEKHQPDVVLLLETNETWKRAMQPIEATYPYQILCPLENMYGLLFYSRFPMLSPELRFLIQDDIPSIYVQLTLESGQQIHFYGVHPMPPSPTEHYRSTERDAELLVVGKEARHKSGPIIVAGDLNDVAWSHTTRLFRRVSGLLDPRIGRGLYSTFNANYFFLRWPLDHVFVSHHFKLDQLRLLPNSGSDHFPILVSLTYQPDPNRLDDVPQPEGDDFEETEDIIEKTMTDKA
ncbi:MAG TPA: endonuclease/exonuclease/phosphatase family protein [Spirosoma sp.]|nr:endonuclease/exonuclease/phosphatase family protein [Spirosoma sp.]